MSSADRKDGAVGYRKPPVHTRFRNGQSGNPGGRPRRPPGGQAEGLTRKELFRWVQVREGDKVKWMPALQAVLRSLVTTAAKGNTAAQRHLLDLALTLERPATVGHAASTAPAMSDHEVARRIAAALKKVTPQKDQKKAKPK